VNASVTNIQAAHEAVLSAQSNLKSMLDGIKAARAAYAAALANVKASQASEGAANANIRSNQANLDRNAILQGFQKVVAPFDGIITDREAQIGSLVSASGGVSSTTGVTSVGAGSSATSSASTSLFSMVRTNSVRVFVSVPENFVGAIRPGEVVQVSIAELGATPIDGTVNRDASVLDAASRTLLTQIDVPNPGGRLRPGMYATVSMTVPQANAEWRIPDTALISDDLGNRVAVITDNDTIHFQQVVIDRDLGREMNISSGLTGNERLVANPNNGLQEGTKVQAVKAKAPAGPGGAKPDASASPAVGMAAPASGTGPQAAVAPPAAGAGQTGDTPTNAAAAGSPNTNAPPVSNGGPQGVNGGTPISPTTTAPVRAGSGSAGGK
jgi:multidrug efflux pump subunit AcrA (membrane-fusion protein)